MKTLTLALTILLLGTASSAGDFANALASGFASDDSESQRERASARAEKEQDLYDDGSDALDDHDWRRAAALFARVAAMRMSHADGALYWRAYALAKLGNRTDALATLVELRKAYPKSRWNEDAKALEVEIRQSAGQPINVEGVADDDVKIMALSGMMNSDPDRAIAILEGLLKSGKQSKKTKDKAIFILTQTDSPRALKLLGELARDNANPDQQKRALRFLGIMGGAESRKLLADVYGSTPHLDTKRTILKSYMIAGDKTHLLQLARGEQNTELRGDAVRQLGILGARNELAELYAVEPAIEVRKSILQAMFIGGGADKLGELARNEKNPELRITAIKNLGLMGSSTGPALVAIYNGDTNREVRQAVIKSLFIQGNTKALSDLSRAEKDPELRRLILSRLSLLKGSREPMDMLEDPVRE